MKTLPILPRDAAGPLRARIQLPLSHRVPLVKLDTVIAARGESVEIIQSHIENGRLHWVFNVAANPDGIRDLRFWNRQLSAFAGGNRTELSVLATLGVDQVVGEILGEALVFRPGQVCLLLGIRRPTLRELRPELQAVGHELFSREGLTQFLIRRRVA